MPYQRRRYGRRSFRSRTIPGSKRQMRSSPGQEFPVFTKDYSHRRLIHTFPSGSTLEPYYVNNNYVGDHPTAQNYHCLNYIPLGSGVHKRPTYKIHMRWLHVKLYLYYPSTIPVLPLVGSITVIYDKEPFGVVMNFNEAYDSYNPLSLTNMANRERFAILYRQTFIWKPNQVWNGTSVVGYQGRDILRELKIPINRKTTYTPGETDGDPDTIKEGALWIWFTNDAAPGATSNVRVNMVHRLSFAVLD